MVVMTGLYVYLRGLTLFAAGSILCSERQPYITGLPLERGCPGCSVNFLRGSSWTFKVAADDVSGS